MPYLFWHHFDLNLPDKHLDFSKYFLQQNSMSMSMSKKSKLDSNDSKKYLEGQEEDYVDRVHVFIDAEAV